MRQDWGQALEAYREVLFLWQDLDGVHWSRLPAEAPATSILWGSSDDRLVRIRLDGTDVLAAEARVGEPGLRREATKPWAEGWGPIAQFRAADGLRRTQGFEMFVRRSPTGAPITFIRPVEADR